VVISIDSIDRSRAAPALTAAPSGAILALSTEVSCRRLRELPGAAERVIDAFGRAR